MPFNPPIPEPKGRGKASGLVGAVVQAEKMVQIALILPCAAFIGWLIGDWMAARLHRPWMVALGVAFGGVAGLFYVIRMALAALNEPVKTGKGKKDGDGSAGRPS